MAGRAAKRGSRAALGTFKDPHHLPRTASSVLGEPYDDDTSDHDLRISFDFVGVLATDESEQVYQTGGIEGFRAHEVLNAAVPHDAGPLKDFLASINRIQQGEEEERQRDTDYRIRLHVSLVTARSARRTSAQ